MASAGHSSSPANKWVHISGAHFSRHLGSGIQRQLRMHRLAVNDPLMWKIDRDWGLGQRARGQAQRLVVCSKQTFWSSW